MSRKLSLTSLILFMKPGTMLQVTVACACASAFACAHIKYQPFSDDNDDMVQSASLLSSICTLWAAGLIVAKDDTPGISVFIVIVNVCVMSVLARRQSARQTMRSVGCANTRRQRVGWLHPLLTEGGPANFPHHGC